MHRILIALAVCAGAEASAQHHSHPAGALSPAGSSAYAGEEGREIKALSAQEQRAWLEGQGAGLARAAELNGYPGPMHVLEHADELGLTADQQERTRDLMQRHKAQARQMGAKLIAAERYLDDLFRLREATPAQVSRRTRQIGRLQARIRALHLNTHLEQAAVLQPGQITAYDRLRGYKR